MTNDHLPDQLRENAKRILKAKNHQQDVCEHRYGNGPEKSYAGNVRNSGFCYLKLPTGEIIGVCLACQKTISSVDPADQKFFTTVNSRGATQVMPESGQLLLEDDNKFFGQLARFTEENRLRIIKATISDLKRQLRKQKDVVSVTDEDFYQVKNHDLTTADMYEMPEEDLKKLAEEQYQRLRKKKI